MKKVNILGFVSVDEMIEKVKSEIEYLNNDYVKTIKKKRGSTVTNVNTCNSEVESDNDSNGEAVADRDGLSDRVGPKDDLFVLQALSGG